jgi:hypothetical protein
MCSSLHNLMTTPINLAHLHSKLAQMRVKFAHLCLNLAYLRLMLAHLRSMLAHLFSKLAHLRLNVATLNTNLAHLHLKLMHLYINVRLDRDWTEFCVNSNDYSQDNYFYYYLDIIKNLLLPKSKKLTLQQNYTIYSSKNNSLKRL